MQAFLRRMSGDSLSFLDLFKPEWLPSLLRSLLLITLAFVCEHFAVAYAFEYIGRSTTSPVGDILLDNLPTVNLNFIIIEIALSAIVAGVLFVVFFRPRYILFCLEALAIFIIARAFFMSLTHVGIYPGHVSPGLGFFDAVYTYFNFQTGFFFSGHTGLPFLVALIFWERPFERTILLALSFIFAVAVLLAHIHYSIDVFAAPFIAYGVFRIAVYLFPRDYEFARSKRSHVQSTNLS